MRKIFIDCGAHNGSSVAYFRSIYKDADEYEIYSFEANPSLIRYYPIPGVNFIDCAVWTEDGEITFYEKVKLGQAPPESSTLMQSKVQFQKDNNQVTSNSRFREVKVRSIDLSRWIKENFAKDDYIVLKVDIECAEYMVLKKMFSENTFEYINEVYGELHHIKCGKSKSQAKDDDKMIYDGLKKHGLEMYYWDANIDYLKNNPNSHKSRMYTDPYENKNWPEPQNITKEK